MVLGGYLTLKYFLGLLSTLLSTLLFSHSSASGPKYLST